MYSTDLAFIHDAGFGDFAERAAPEVIRIRAHEALSPGGVFVFDFIESGVRRTYPMKVHGDDHWVIAVHAELDRAKRNLTRRIVAIRKVGRQYRRTQETHRQRVYNRRAVATALADAGFTATMSRSYGRYRLMAGDVAV